MLDRYTRHSISSQDIQAVSRVLRGPHIAQGREEGALNHAGQYCLDNLINRLYEK